MLDQKFWQSVNEAQENYEVNRRKIIGVAADALHRSKQAIFALHRDDLPGSAEKLKEAEVALKALEEEFAKDKKLRYDGAWSAALEEFIEAKLFYFFVAGETVGEIKDLHLEPNEYIGGLSDYSGELVRRAVLLASQRKFDEVQIIAEEIRSVIEKLLAYNLVGYLRTKFDQAKKNLNKIEEIVYEITLKR